MKKSNKILAAGIALALSVSVGAVFAANTTATSNQKATTKTVATKVTTTATAPAKVKLSQDDVTKIALAAHKGATIVGVKLNVNVYVVTIQTAKGERILKIGGNTGKILGDTAVAIAPAKTAPVKTNAVKTTTTPKK